MAVRRIVANLAGDDLPALASFYRELFALETVMDHGWIVTLAASDVATPPQLSVASRGGSGMPVPALSIEVDSLEPVIEAMAQRGIAPDYGPVDEPWGVRRLFVRDPGGRLVNVVMHRGDGR